MVRFGSIYLIELGQPNIPHEKMLETAIDVAN